MLRIFTLTLAAFAIGTSEYIVVGLLPEIASDLNVPITDAGLLVTAYSLGVVFGAPILTISTYKIRRKILLELLIISFIIGNIACAISADYYSLLFSRVIASLCHGTFFGVASIAAADLAKKGQEAKAIAYVFMGVTLANMLGVPIGTFIGQFSSWRFAFFSVAIIGLVSLIAVRIVLPKNIPMRDASIIEEIKAVLNTKVLVSLSLAVISSTSLFIIFTYITPIINDVSMIAKENTSYVLFLVGLGLTVGTLLGGVFGDKNLIKTMILAMFLILCTLITLHYILPYKVTAVLGLFIWSILGFSLCPMIQLSTLSLASSSPSLASTLNQSAFHLGNASGAWISSYLLALGYSGYINFKLTDLPFAAAVVTFIGMTAAIYLKYLIKSEKV